ncbi:hypothetical protein PCANB_001159 [Pneumocystis canis]|nr:hypothetical protein PCANB_001159 [Pneumocystis canis]
MDNKGKRNEGGRGLRMTGLFSKVKTIKNVSNKVTIQNDEINTQDVEARHRRFEKTLSENRYKELKPEREREREEATRLGLIDDPNKPKRLHQALTFIGTCQDMCPLFEREQREYQKNLERWEINPLTGRVDKNLAVKAFHRPAAGNEQALPSDVRPPHILKSTLDYLIDRIVCGGDSLSETHSFVRDRTRSIRQDFTFQNSRGLEAVECHERIARYHILCLHQLCEVKNFSQQQENEQLQKVLQSLAEFYDDLRCLNIQCPHEPEFRAYHILSRIQDPDVIRQAQTLPQELLFSFPIQHSLKLYALVQRNNKKIGIHKIPNTEAAQNLFTRFFKLIASEKTTYLMACSVEMHFPDIRKGALKAMRRSYLANHSPFPIDELAEMLGCDSIEEAAINCESYGLVVDKNAEGTPLSVHIHKSSPWDETQSSIKQRFSKRLVEAKRGSQSFSDVINGLSNEPCPTYSLFPTLKKQTIDETLELPDPCLDSNTFTFQLSHNNTNKKIIEDPKPSVFLSENNSFNDNGENNTNNKFLDQRNNENILGLKNEQHFEFFLHNKQKLPNLLDLQYKPLEISQNIPLNNIEIINNHVELLNSNNQIKNSCSNKHHFYYPSDNINQNLFEAKNIPEKKLSKKISKEQFLDILNWIFFKMINDQIRTIITFIKNEIEYYKEKKSRVIEEFAIEITESLIVEVIFEIVFECAAEDMNKRNILKKIFKIMERKYKLKILQKKKLEQIKTEQEQKSFQYYTALKEIDIINVKKKNKERGIYRFIDRETDENMAETLKKTHHHINKLWKNENLNNILISKLRHKSETSFNFWELLVFSSDYKTSTSFWLRQKFELKANLKEFSWKLATDFGLNIRIVMPMINLLEKSYYKNIGAVIFECSPGYYQGSLLSAKWEVWKHQLHTMIHSISFENTFKFPLLIIYWIDPDIDIPLDTIFDIPLLKKTYIQLTSVEFFKIVSIEETILKNPFEHLLSLISFNSSDNFSPDFKGIKRLKLEETISDETENNTILFAEMPQNMRKKIRRRNAFSFKDHETSKNTCLIDKTDSSYPVTLMVEPISIRKLFDNIRTARKLLTS